MSSRLADTTSSLVQAALRLSTAKHQPADHPHAGDIAHEQLILAARDLVCAVNSLEPDRQPARWARRVPCSLDRTAPPEIAPYSEDGEDCPACTEIQDKCRYHQGAADAIAGQTKAA
ncbi:hypothetical protein [Streptomyces lydicamycinicus]|uniref:hypothetical protein n=1 Tax=Streptomyces lydicamycinicus TaxID=1546107 RepID=UPI003C30838F